MGKGRMISSEIWEDDYFIELTLLERMIWIGLLTCSADDQGRLQDNKRLIHSQLFPVDDLDDNMIEHALKKFADSGKVIRYSVDGKKIIQIKNWWRYQSPRWAGKSKYRPPEKWIDRERYHAAGNIVMENNWKLQGGFPEDSIAGNTINDVNGEVNGDGEVNGEVDGKQPNGDCGDLIDEFCNITGKVYHQGRKAEVEWDAPLASLKIKGATASDLRTAIQELDAKNYPIVSPKSIVTACELVINRRNRKNGGNRKLDSTGQFAEYINH